MSKRFSMPSPSMIVALVALFVALSGTAVAAGTLAKNSVGNKQLKKNAVTGSKVKNDSLTGSDVNESTLVVPTATNATNATNATKASSVADGSITGASVKDGSLSTNDISRAHGTINLNFGSIAANDCALSVQQPVPGVDLTQDIIVVSPNYGTLSTNLSVTGGNSSNPDGFFRLVVCNPTTGAIDPPATDFHWAAIPNS